MQKILFLSRLYAPHVGGVEKHVEKVVAELQARGNSVTLITEQYSPDLKLRETRRELEIFRIPKEFLSSKVALWRWIITQRQLFFEADVIHIHDVFWWMIPVILFTRHKTWITFHGYEGAEAPGIKQIFWHWVASKLTRGNLCIGGFHQKWYHVKPNLVSFGAVEVLKSAGNKPKKDSILFFGRMAEDTGILYYIRAMEILQQSGEHYTLDVYGDGPLKNTCEKIVKEKQLPVRFFAFQPNIAQRIDQYSIVFVSRYLSILEALAVGVPVVAQYNNQIKADYLRLSPFADWIQIVQTPEEIAQAVLNIQKPSHEAKKWAHAQTWDKLTDQYEELWASK